MLVSRAITQGSTRSIMRLPRQLVGRGTLTLSLEIDGMLANLARVAIKGSVGDEWS
jgi:hypothetical protein